MPADVVYYQWQNEYLVEDIYPFRVEKLQDFLAIFYEIDLWNDFQSKDDDDPLIKNIIVQAINEITQKRTEIEVALNAAIAERLLTDEWFASISSPNEENLKRKRLYYIDRVIELDESKVANRETEKARLVRKLDLYPTGHAQRDEIKAQLKEKETQILEIQSDLKELQNLKNLYDQWTVLPSVPEMDDSIKLTAARWMANHYRESELVGKDQFELIKLIFVQEERFQQFEEWLLYMVIHFSGMRYKSAHASWADPKYLLELLTIYDTGKKISEYDDTELERARQHAIDELQASSTQLYKEYQQAQDELAQALNLTEDERQKKEKEITDQYDQQLRTLKNTLARLNYTYFRNALIDYLAEKVIDEFQDIEDEDQLLEILEEFRARKAAEGNPIPEWVWSEISKYTKLRLKTESDDWEAFDPERWKWENREWYELLTTWEGSDITGWREHHRETLDLIVTRAVCNEISEQIQHLRGVKPSGGLTGNVAGYFKLQETSTLPEDDPNKPYFKRAYSVADFKCGASIFWLAWVDDRPNAWRACNPLGIIDFLPKDANLLYGANANYTPDAWTYQLDGNVFKRVKRPWKKQELKKLGKSDEEIAVIMREKNIQYLRWTHEAVVVGVGHMIDGDYVLTFETGEIGLNLRWLDDLVDNRNVFVGYAPAANPLPASLRSKLEKMLDKKKILRE